MPGPPTTTTDADTDVAPIALDPDGDVQLPLTEILTGRVFVTGKSGSGKSNTASVLAEEVLDRGFPILIVDADGEYWGLKEKYEILHVGADEECDIQVGPEHAEKLAQLALDENIPIVLDVSGFLETDDAHAIVRETTRHLFNREKTLQKPFLLFIEEIHEYVPEAGGLDETGQMLVRVAKRGRKRGLGLCAISQRPADVKKDLITQCDWFVWHRLTWDNDTSVVRRVVNRETADAVSDLADGEGFLMADFRETDIERVQVRRKQTFDAGATPDLGEFERPELKSVSGDLVSELREISAQTQREQDRIAQLEAELETKQEEIDELEEDLARAQDMSEMAQQFTSALTASGGDTGDLQRRVDEIREEKNSEIQELRRERDDLADRLDDAEQTVTEQRERIQNLERVEQAVEHLDELEEAIARAADALGLDAGDADVDRYRRRIDELETEVDRLHSEATVVDEQFSEKMDFVRTDAVRQQIETAAEKAKTNPPHTWDVVFFLADCDEPVSVDAILPVVNVGESSVRDILTTLTEQHIVFVNQTGKKHTYRLNVDGMETVIDQQRRREEMDDLREEVGVSDS